MLKGKFMIPILEETTKKSEQLSNSPGPQITK